MPVIQVSASTTPVPAIVVHPSLIGKILSIEINNNTSSAVTVNLVDTFTPTPSAENPSPTQVNKPVRTITVPANDVITIQQLQIDVFGQLMVSASVDSTDVTISISYDIQ